MNPPPAAFRSKIVVLAGATGVGKTAAALALAEKFTAEIVNADSMQIYRFLDIGTAKPSPAERARVTHHLIDIIAPDEAFNAAAYLKLARPLVRRLDEKGTRALVVGGAGLYLRSLIRGLFAGPGEDQAIRARLKAEAVNYGPKALHERLSYVDQQAAAVIHPNDLFRIIRALEVFEITGRPVSGFREEHRLADMPYEYLFFALTRPRPELYRLIEQRTRDMFARGLVAEVSSLLDLGYSPDLKPFKAIGYKQAVDHLLGRLTISQAVEEVIRQTRRYAKRQETWFKKQPEVRYESPDNLARLEAEIARFWG